MVVTNNVAIRTEAAAEAENATSSCNRSVVIVEGIQIADNGRNLSQRNKLTDAACIISCTTSVTQWSRLAYRCPPAQVRVAVSGFGFRV